jgi:hypothetical protein
VQPEITSAVVLNALRRIGLPALEVQIQPEDKTLVNFDTIFYAEPQTVTRDLTLLGQRVQVQATPSSYAWSFGDGAGTSTRTPGAPYPAKDMRGGDLLGAVPGQRRGVAGRGRHGDHRRPAGQPEDR